ncbi:protein CEBPZOS isoform X1 [Cervus elaphus]|uniref:protein CEBPZOS isoform X1 n=1 Tax=Cervus elaphus TaxID=9860 RepID=UPI001CC2B49B|nr:protein CEBPZOS isoform X1 [Cervus elaphus]XP_043774169.1 protein CEBPZOS isoform X1 [Cervus elaphus]XP_043774170.1 protein CEBPZOS isoform X1 [Cervus elaphus]
MLSPGSARACTRLRASDSATEAAAQGSGASYRRPVLGWGGGRGARAAVAPAAGPRCSRAATVSGSSASLGGSLSVSFSPRTPPSFGRPGPSRTGPHRSAQGPRSPETRPPLGVRARAPGALQPPPQLLGLSPARVIEPAVPDTSQQLGDSPAS